MNEVNMEHPTEIMLQEYSGRMLDRAIQNALDDHVRLCEECALKLRALRLLDEKLREIPPDSAEKDFTRRVMASLRIDPAPAVYWSIAKYLAPVLSLILVLVVVYAVFYFSGAIQGPENRQSAGRVSAMGEYAGTMATDGIKALNAWGGKYFSFVIAKGSIDLTIFLLIVFAGVAALDKYILVPMMRKKS
jgi:hypothetical protein